MGNAMTTLSEAGTAGVRTGTRRRSIPQGRGGSPTAKAENRAAYIFLAPWFVGLFGITITPIIASLFLSFTDFHVLTAPHWIGLQNYTDLLHDRRFSKTIGVTLKYVGWSVPLILIFRSDLQQVPARRRRRRGAA